MPETGRSHSSQSAREGARFHRALAEERESAAAQRALLAFGKNPLTVRRAALVLEHGSMAFAECAEAFIKAHAPGWRNVKHRDQWRKTLTTYAFPVMGDLP